MFKNYSEYADFKRKNINDVENLLEINKMIKPYKWLFVHPFIQNFWLFRIRDLHLENKLTEEIVSDTFIRDFYDLERTSSFVDGYCERSEIIRPFNYYIENSIILAFQKDYAGAINLIIPVIEGVLAKYLTEYKNKDLSKNRYDKIRGAISNIKEDILLQYSDNVKEIEYYGNKVVFNQQQQEQLINYERIYLESFCSIIDDFFKNSLFCNSSDQNDISLLNRHQIFHSLNLDVYHTLENYIKLFNSIKFLTWLLLRFENKSLLNQVDNKIAFKKHLFYEELLIQSASLIPIKHQILNSYNLHNSADLKRKPLIRKLSHKLNGKQKIVLKLLKLQYHKRALKDLE